MSTLVKIAERIYRKIIWFNTTFLQPVFLLIVRLYWGWQFFQTGMGKLSHLDKTTGFFQTLGIPFPQFNAYLAGGTECVAGLLLLLGLATRITTIPLIVLIMVAYATASPDALHSFFSKPDDFLSADEFLFLFAAIIVFIFGPGILSLDGLIAGMTKYQKDKNREAAGVPL